MPIRLSPTIIIPVVLGTAAVAFFVSDRTPSAAPSSPDPQVADIHAAAGAPMGPLPANHPPVAGMASAVSGHGPHGAIPNGESQQPPSLRWTVPSSWQTLPNPNPMRLATYKVTDGAEASVARAGGSVQANVERWTAQFEGQPNVDRSDREVHGLKVTVVHIAGTFLGGGMGATVAETHEGWAMLAAVVEASGPPYFFKVIGPVDQVDGARAKFDELLNTVTPAAAP